MPNNYCLALSKPIKLFCQSIKLEQLCRMFEHRKKSAESYVIESRQRKQNT